MVKNNHLIFPSIPNYNKKRPLALSNAILNENPNSVVHLFPVHGERLSLRPESARTQPAAQPKYVRAPETCALAEETPTARSSQRVRTLRLPAARVD